MSECERRLAAALGISVEYMKKHFPPALRRGNRILQRIKKYDLTIDQYEDMWVDQEGKCAICKAECSAGKELAIDHCHKTGKVRGLLCNACNASLGLVKENKQTLLAMIEYLDSHAPSHSSLKLPSSQVGISKYEHEKEAVV